MPQTEVLVKLFLAEMFKSTSEKLRYLFDMMHQLLLVTEDGLQSKRVKMFMGPFFDTLAAKRDVKEEIPVCRQCAQLLQTHILAHNKATRKWMQKKKNESKWNWVNKWYEKTRAHSTFTYSVPD